MYGQICAQVAEELRKEEVCVMCGVSDVWCLICGVSDVCC